MCMYAKYVSLLITDVWLLAWHLICGSLPFQEKNLKKPKPLYYAYLS